MPRLNRWGKIELLLKKLGSKFHPLFPPPSRRPTASFLSLSVPQPSLMIIVWVILALMRKTVCREHIGMQREIERDVLCSVVVSTGILVMRLWLGNDEKLSNSPENIHSMVYQLEIFFLVCGYDLLDRLRCSQHLKSRFIIFVQFGSWEFMHKQLCGCKI